MAAALAASYAGLRVVQVGGRDEQRPVDAIVVMGAAQYDGRPSPVFEARLDHAVALFLGDVAPRLVVTGGGAPGDRTTEAAVGRAFAEGHGVPSEAILAEDTGRNTLESLRAVAALLEDRGLRRVLIVSDRTHMLRSLRIARDLGLDAYGSPTPTSPTDRDGGLRAASIVHELGALAVYFITGRSPGVEVAGAAAP